MHRTIRIVHRSQQSIQWNVVRSVSHIKVKEAHGDHQSDNHSKEWENARPYTEIPGPTKYQLIRGFLPGGIYYKKTLNDVTLLAHKKYGDIFMVPGLFGTKSLLMLFNPDDFPKVFRCEGIWPKRRLLETMKYHRIVHRKDDFGEIIGLLSSNNEEWAKLRSAVNPVLMQPRNARLYLNKMLEVNDEFLERIREIRDPNTLEMPDSFEDEINRLTFESVAVVALNRQVGLIRKDRNNEDASRLFQSLRSIFDLAFHLEISPSLWRIMRTPKFNQIIKSYDTMYEIIMKYINQALDRIENEKLSTNNEGEQSVLEKLLKIDKRVAVVMALDMLMVGVDTASTTLVGILLCIAKNPKKQEKLRQEIRAILPQKDSQLTQDNMASLPYLKACIKEGMRLYTIGAGIMRSNAEDVVLSGYRVPKRQDMIVNSNFLFRDEKYYPRPEEFIPERWLRDDKSNSIPSNPFIYTPFGHGARSCVGKRIVDLELEITVTRLVRNFYIEFNYPTENAFKSQLLNVPAIPLNFKFSEVEN